MKINSIMVVDDGEADQYITKRVIESFDSNIDLVQAHNGKQALEVLNSGLHEPDVILLDINMPVMNGFEFLDEYSLRDSPCSVVVMMTSSSQEGDIQRSMRYSCVKKYIVKPLDTTDLEELVNLVSSVEAG